MIKLLIFDVDGVIVQSKKLHEISFIMALRKFGYNLTSEQHKLNLDGLPTKIKLDKLNIPENIRKEIFDLKQKYTFEKANEFINKNDNIKNIFVDLNKKYRIAIASNAIRDFCELIIKLLDIKDNINFVMTNEDVEKPKPNPMIYNKIIEHFNITNKEVVIFEDSKFGLKSAFLSGANVYYVENPSYLNIQDILKFIEVCEC